MKPKTEKTKPEYIPLSIYVLPKNTCPKPDKMKQKKTKNPIAKIPNPLTPALRPCHACELIRVLVHLLYLYV
jgi:hypothetical protein